MVRVIPVARAEKFNGEDGKEQLNPPIPSGQTMALKAMVPLKSFESETVKKKDPALGV